MTRITVEKAVLTAIMATWVVALPPVGYQSGISAGGDIWLHLIYMYSHANVWHMTGNLFVLWVMKDRLYLVPAMVTAFTASYLPSWSAYGDIGLTMGFSGVLFAIAGIKWGRHIRKADNRKAVVMIFCRKVLPFAFVGLVLPHVNWCPHLYCLIGGLLYGRCRR